MPLRVIAGVPMGAGVRARGRSLVRSGAQQLAAQQEQDRVRVRRVGCMHTGEHLALQATRAYAQIYDQERVHVSRVGCMHNGEGLCEESWLLAHRRGGAGAYEEGLLRAEAGMGVNLQEMQGHLPLVGSAGPGLHWKPMVVQLVQAGGILKGV
eukprot:1154233-Pelagomonas_calceolata.AAC.3